MRLGLMTIEIIFWTQIASAIAFVVALFVLYRILVEQKDSTIQLQKENIAYLKDQLADAKSQSPDLLVQSLSNRVKHLEEELKRLKEDKSSTQEQVKAKETELRQACEDVEKLTQQIIYAKNLLNDFLCPECEAPLSEKAYRWKSVRHQGREIEVIQECTSFTCGYEIMDGDVVGLCKNSTVR